MTPSERAIAAASLTNRAADFDLASAAAFEEWRQAPGLPDGYLVSNLGRVRSPRGLMRGSLWGCGTVYRRVLVRRRQHRVHRLVCEAFHGPAPAERPMVRHLDGDSLNNQAENLCWGTHAENTADRTAHGRTLRGEDHGRAYFTNDQVREIRRRLADGVVGRRLAEEYGVHETVISAIKGGKTYSCVL